MEMFLGFMLGLCWGGFLVFLVYQIQIEKLFRGWQNTIDAWDEYHKNVVVYKEQVEKFLKELKKEVEESIKKEECTHQTTVNGLCIGCGKALYPN